MRRIISASDVRELITRSSQMSRPLYNHLITFYDRTAHLKLHRVLQETRESLRTHARQLVDESVRRERATRRTPLLE